MVHHNTIRYNYVRTATINQDSDDNNENNSNCNSNSNQEDDEVTLSPLNDKMEQQAISYLDKGDQLKNILHVLNGYHVDAKRIPSVIKKILDHDSG